MHIFSWEKETNLPNLLLLQIRVCGTEQYWYRRRNKGIMTNERYNNEQTRFPSLLNILRYLYYEINYVASSLNDTVFSAWWSIAGHGIWIILSTRSPHFHAGPMQRMHITLYYPPWPETSITSSIKCDEQRLTLVRVSLPFQRIHLSPLIYWHLPYRVQHFDELTSIVISMRKSNVSTLAFRKSGRCGEKSRNGCTGCKQRRVRSHCESWLNVSQIESSLTLA